ncbi:gamma-glutamylcyclotransferase family protein [Fulvimarina sp. MAC3]|uniref:gamma-glutamylcyclotransferase family protein n=1 Tax=Fulvimarina sp. MAC3 TaxID=3148887 RepID=UPI0031FE3D76
MTDYIAFYGSLMERANDSTAPSRAGLSKFVGPCRMAGTLRDHGAYPGFFLPDDKLRASADRGVVEGELHQLVGIQAFTIFDGYEDYFPDNEAGSLYIRRKIRLIEPDVEAWVYISQLSSEDPIVPGGDWPSYRRARL